VQAQPGALVAVHFKLDCRPYLSTAGSQRYFDKAWPGAARRCMGINLHRHLLFQVVWRES
jgi:hypothetical protein